MEKNGTFSVIKEDGSVRGPADRETIRRWAYEGSIGVNDQLMLADGRRIMVLQDDDLRVPVSATQSFVKGNPGLRNIIIGALMLSVAVVLTMSKVLAPQALNLVPGHGTYEMSLVIWWVIMGVLFVGGGVQLFRGFRERSRADFMKAESL